MTASVFMFAIDVFDCGQKRQSLAHFLDDQEKHRGRRRERIGSAYWRGRLLGAAGSPDRSD
jgi:hypothetical protein